MTPNLSVERTRTGMVNFLATRLPELLIIFAENDERINAAWPVYEAAL